MLIGRKQGLGRRGIGALAVVVLALVLASCGGGTAQIEPFAPQRIIVLGDENAGLAPDGKRWAINGLDANAAFDCQLQPLWTQMLVTAFGMVLDRCNPGGATDVRGLTRAAANAKALDLDAQIDAVPGPITSKDLFLVMVGMNDILELYALYPTRTEADLTNELRARGTHVADQVNRIIAAGARVILSTVHDVSLSPYSRSQQATNSDTDRMALLSRLTAVFNARVRVDIVQDGRYVGLVLADENTQLAVRNPSFFTGLTNVIDAACTVAAPDCTSATLIAGASGDTNLWADDRRFAQALHTRLAVLAETRARNNPF